MITIRNDRLSLRIDPDNPDHHLYNNNGTWWVHYTVYPTRATAERIRRSLGTRDLATARRRRDELLAALMQTGGPAMRSSGVDCAQRNPTAPGSAPERSMEVAA